MKYLERTAKGIAGGVFCALTWWALDQFVWFHPHDFDHYTTVAIAYLCGTGPISNA